MMRDDYAEDDQPYLSPQQYYSPSRKNPKKLNTVYLDISAGDNLSSRLPNEVNMGGPSPRSRSKQVELNLEASLSTSTFNKAKGPCANCANILVCITGVLNTLIGFFLLSISVGVLIGASKYELLGEDFFTGMRVLLAGGFLLAFCYIILMVAICNRTKPCWKAALIAVYIFLLIIFLLEISTVGLAFWSHSVIASPAGKQGDNVAANWLLSHRHQFAKTTYHACCVAFKPPYSGANATEVDGICTWPESTQTIKDSCAGTNVLVCVCENGPQEYESSINFFLRQYLTYIASTLMIIASVLLAGLVSVYALMCSDAGNRSNKYSNEHTDMDPHGEEIIYAT